MTTFTLMVEAIKIYSKPQAKGGNDTDEMQSTLVDRLYNMKPPNIDFLKRIRIRENVGLLLVE
jgi:hypothetical protein